MSLKHRASRIWIPHLLAVGLLLVWPASSRAQTVVATIPIAGVPRVVAVNPVTNKIYVASCNAHIDPPTAISSITVIDGATNSATSLPGGCPAALAVNTVTNKIYFPGGVIDGATNSLTPLPGGGSLTFVSAVAVNPVTNKIYVGGLNGNVTVIDGAINSATTVTDPNANGLSSASIAVNSVTNKIYVANSNPLSAAPGNVTVIDGVTNAITTVTDTNAISPVSIAVNSVTNKIYVANHGSFGTLNHGNITVIDGATNAITTLADPNAEGPQSVGVNETTNTIYVANVNDSALSGIGGVSVIDGTSNSIFTLTDPNAQFPSAVAVDSATNMIYVANQGCFLDDPCINRGSTSVINGATKAVTTLINPNATNPAALAVDSTTNRIYVANFSGSVTVIDGGAVPTTHVLSLLVAGTGSGTVTSLPAGINCSTSCIASFAAGTNVSLTALPASGDRFSGWSGPCAGSGSCDLMMTSDNFVTASFGPALDFSIQSAATQIQLQRGGRITDVITISPVGGAFESSIQLSCSVSAQTLAGELTLPTCALSESSVTPGANSVTSTLTVTTPGRSARLTPSREVQRAGSLYAVFLPIPGLTLIGLGLAIGKPTNRRRRLWLLGSILVVFVGLQTGCGGGSSGQQTQPQNYIVAVTGVSGTIQHTTLVDVSVP